MNTVPTEVLNIIGIFRYQTKEAWLERRQRAARKIQHFTRSRLPDQHTPRCGRCGEELYYSQHGRLCPLCSQAERGRGRGYENSFRTTRSKKARRRKKLRRGKEKQRSKSARRKLKK